MVRRGLETSLTLLPVSCTGIQSSCHRDLGLSLLMHTDTMMARCGSKENVGTNMHPNIGSGCDACRSQHWVRGIEPLAILNMQLLHQQAPIKHKVQFKKHRVRNTTHLNNHQCTIHRAKKAIQPFYAKDQGLSIISSLSRTNGKEKQPQKLNTPKTTTSQSEKHDKIMIYKNRRQGHTHTHPFSPNYPLSFPSP